jgi:hypothetical protein
LRSVFFASISDASRVARRGSSQRIVPTPTPIASTSARTPCACRFAAAEVSSVRSPAVEAGDGEERADAGIARRRERLEPVAREDPFVDERDDVADGRDRDVAHRVDEVLLQVGADARGAGDRLADAPRELEGDGTAAELAEGIRRVGELRVDDRDRGRSSPPSLGSGGSWWSVTRVSTPRSRLRDRSREDVPLSTLMTSFAPVSRAFATECAPNA